MLIYLACPVDMDQEGKVRHQVIRNALLAARHSTSMLIFDAMEAYHGDVVTNQDAVNVVKINQEALFAADLVVIFRIPGVESWGVPIELQFAKEESKKIIVTCFDEVYLPYQSLPVYLRYNLDPKQYMPLSRLCEILHSGEVFDVLKD